MGIGVGWGREGEVSYYKQHNTACRSTRKEMMGVIEVSTPQGNGRVVEGGEVSYYRLH